MSVDIDEVVRMEQAATHRDVLLFDLGLVEVERGLIAALEKAGTFKSGGTTLEGAGESSPHFRIQFAQGTLLALGTLCTTLIGKGVLERGRR